MTGQVGAAPPPSLPTGAPSPPPPPPPCPGHGGWPAPPPPAPGPRGQTGCASHTHGRPICRVVGKPLCAPRRPVSLKIGPQIKPNQIKSNPPPPPFAQATPCPPPPPLLLHFISNPPPSAPSCWVAN